jgi:hypothetical protein
VSREPLRKAPDAEVHPTAPAAEESALLRGGATSDAVSDRPVTLTVQVPKSLRKSVRAEAERRKVSVDQVVAEALRDRRHGG